jgi:hypothetical protein
MGKVLSAQGSGYFPICIPKLEPYLYQTTIPLTLEQAMALFWRVKVWEAKVSGGWNDPNDPDYGTTTFINSNSYVNMVAQGVTPEINSEAEYICNGNGLFEFSRLIEVNRETPSGNSSGTGPLIMQYGFSSDFDARRSGNTYYPYFIISTISCSSENASGFSVVGAFNLRISTHVITGFLYTLIERSAIGDVQIDIRPKEYWSYDGTWNTETGDKL